MEVSDGGPGVAAPTRKRTSPSGRRGYGMMLMRSLMDKVDFLPTARGTRVVLVKRLPC